jgi:hypothetical protein
MNFSVIHLYSQLFQVTVTKYTRRAVEKFWEDKYFDAVI